MRPEDQRRVRQAFELARRHGDRTWKNWSKSPFAVLLVTPDYEFLVRHPRPTPDFQLAAKDPLLGKVFYRKRVFQPNLLATFPAVGGVSTIVVGQPENTNVNSPPLWILKVIHEHFHQWQDSQKKAFAEYEALGLARGDQTGMWMLNYPFPYDDEELNRKFANLSQTLLTAIKAESGEFQDKLREYRNQREEFRKALKEDDFKYFSFQLWKEGVALYTELHVARNRAGSPRISRITQEPMYSPQGDLGRALAEHFWGDDKAYEQAAMEIGEEIFSKLPNLSLKERRRIAFYTFGAAEALLLDRANPEWRKQYMKKKFFLEQYYPKPKNP